MNRTDLFKLSVLELLEKYQGPGFDKIEDLPGEEWRDYVGFEGYFEISNIGRIKDILKNTIKLPHKHDSNRARRNEKKYLAYTLKRPGEKKKTEQVHRAVARAFLGERPEGLECIHKDGHINYGFNNRSSNIKYGTPAENVMTRDNHASRRTTRFTVEEIHYIRYSKKLAAVIAEEFNVGVSSITNIRRDKAYTHPKYYREKIDA